MASPTQFIHSEEVTIEAVDSNGDVRLSGASGIRTIRVKNSGQRNLFTANIGKRVNIGPAVDLPVPPKKAEDAK